MSGLRAALLAAASSPADAARSRDRARAHDLYRRARLIHEEATIARDATAAGRTLDLARAEMAIKRIAVLAGGGEI